MEPIYSYVRGKGWIIQSGIVLELNDGTAVYEFRKPNEGEKFSFFETQEELDEHLEGVKRNPRAYYIKYYANWYAERKNADFTHFLTLVPL